MANPTADGQAFAVQINGVKLRGPGKLSQIAAPSVEADNEFGKEPLVKIVELADGTPRYGAGSTHQCERLRIRR